MNTRMDWVRWMGCVAVLGLAVGEAAGQSLQLSVDPATTAWAGGQRDLTVKVSLQNTGAAFNIWSGTFYVGVTGSNPGTTVTVWNVKLAGEQGSDMYLAGTFLQGISDTANQWVQTPLQNVDPDADPGLPDPGPGNAKPAQWPVSAYNTSQIAINYDLANGTSGTPETIPAGATAPFAEITLRRSGNLNVAGSWTLNLFNKTGASDEASFFVAADGLNTRRNMSLTTTTISAPVQTLQAWKELHFPSNTGNGNTDVASGDNLSNIEKFAYGLDPKTPVNVPLSVSGGTIQRGKPAIDVATTVTSVGMKARFVRRKAEAGGAAVTYSVQFSPDVTFPAPATVTSTAPPAVVASDDEFEVVEVEYPLFLDGRKAGFFRVNVSEAPGS